MLLLVLMVHAQQAVRISNKEEQHIFTYHEIDVLEDSTARMRFEQLDTAAFGINTTGTPQTHRPAAAYWYRIKIHHDTSVKQSFLLEFFDQTIDAISAYVPDKNGRYDSVQLGDSRPFKQRLFNHKNFELNIHNDSTRDLVYYFRVQSSQTADIIIVLRTVHKFIGYALDEYFSFGIFYGMILIFSFYNLIMFIAMRQRQYLWYILYILSVGLFEMSTDGIAYQYLWPRSPRFNQYGFALPLMGMSIFALLFTRALLYVKARAPRLNRVISWVIGARVLLFAGAVCFAPQWLNYKFIDVVPLFLAFCTGIYIWLNGYRPARFFVLGYSFLFVGCVLKLLIMLGFTWLNSSIISYYSLGFCFVMEMFFLSFAIGDKLRLLKKKKELAHREIIKQMTLRAELKDSLNAELERQVQERTQELVDKNELIASQNEELSGANELLQQQAEEISRINALLQHDNEELQTSVKKVSRARVLSAQVDFEEFSRIYPDRDSCFEFLAQLKWKEAYACRKCRHDQYFAGHLPFSRRCTKCDYEESVMANTIFQNTKIPINKAFYMIFLIYTSKGKISSHKLATLLDIRQSTCWAYLNRVRTLMEERKKELRDAGDEGWSKLVL
ncbi:7TM diverse intracellular signaling domain-containing protein [Deminuibacter soli]|uniref:Chromosome partitioning protein ParA n=1 Tax=Deminuibacter soli TaxID=2291815 RepID=A0A3E1NEF1_9BACT|nr:7TM diverse intracellular signaling domain-containing protein [Deminuibacter soli]RFM26363.1 chromosome partitioning protein ParA [Deminuibacter soli]